MSSKIRTCEFCDGPIGASAELMSGHCNELSRKPDECTLRSIYAVIAAFRADPSIVPTDLFVTIERLAKRYDDLLEQGY